MDKGPTGVPKWVLINWPEIPQMPQSLSAQIFCPSLKVGIPMKKGVRSLCTAVSQVGQPETCALALLLSAVLF